MNKFNIPIVIFIFRRKKAVEIINRISLVKPSKVYIISDAGRNEQERNEVNECRQKVEEAINWECEIIKNYADENRGVYENIGMGAKWVFEREKYAIFLEDDNLPEITFFYFCREMLFKYKDDMRVLWVCGTNYLGSYEPKDGASYMFTKHMLPCGWASWDYKFNKFYDGELKLCKDEVILSRIKKQYQNNKLYQQYKINWTSEYNKIINGEKPRSWDYQIDFAIKANGLYGICPNKNQIKNIGVDEYSTHGGTSFDNVMTRRFCGMNSYPMEFPLKHPSTVLPDNGFEEEIANILLYPLKQRFISKVLRIIKNTLGFSEDVKLKDIIKTLKKR